MKIRVMVFKDSSDKSPLRLDYEPPKEREQFIKTDIETLEKASENAVSAFIETLQGVTTTKNLK